MVIGDQQVVNLSAFRSALTREPDQRGVSMAALAEVWKKRYEFLLFAGSILENDTALAARPICRALRNALRERLGDGEARAAIARRSLPDGLAPALMALARGSEDAIAHEAALISGGLEDISQADRCLAMLIFAFGGIPADAALTRALAAPSALRLSDGGESDCRLRLERYANFSPKPAALRVARGERALCFPVPAGEALCYVSCSGAFARRVPSLSAGMLGYAFRDARGTVCLRDWRGRELRRYEGLAGFSVDAGLLGFRSEEDGGGLLVAADAQISTAPASGVAAVCLSGEQYAVLGLGGELASNIYALADVPPLIDLALLPNGLVGIRRDRRPYISAPCENFAADDAVVGVSADSRRAAFIELSGTARVYARRADGSYAPEFALKLPSCQQICVCAGGLCALVNGEALLYAGPAAPPRQLARDVCELAAYESDIVVKCLDGEVYARGIGGAI